MPGDIFEKPFRMLIKSTQGVCHPVTCLLVMRCRQLVTLVFYRSPQADVRALIMERVAGKHAKQAAHGIPSVQCGLRAAQHVHAFHVQQFNVVGTFVGISHVVYVQSYGRGVDARTDAADVSRRGQTAAVIRHVEVRYESRKFLQRSSMLVV